MNKFFTILLLGVFFAFSNVQAEEGDDNIIIHFQSAHFNNKGSKLDIPGSYNNKLGLGAEVMYQYFVSNKVAFAAGINYQSGKISAETNSNDRFHFGELSMSLMIKKYQRSLDKTNWYYSAGICPGTIINNNWERTKTGAFWEKVNKSLEPNYTDDSFFVDLYVDGGFSYPLGPMASVCIAPYFRYRVKDNWFGNYRSDASFGIKVGIQLQFEQ